MIKRILRPLPASVLLILIAVQPALAQSGDRLRALQTEVEGLKQRQLTVEKELQEIKALLRGRAAAAEPQNVVLGVDGHPAKGDAGARVTLIEFSDYQCPFCGRYFRDTLPQLQKEYVETGKVRYVFRNFPIESIHPQAFKAAEAAECAGEQGKYWEMHDRLFGNQSALAPADLPGHARALGLDGEKFEKCLESSQTAESIRQDLADAQKAGVRGTPSFFLGLTVPGGEGVKAVQMIQGAQPYAAFKEAIDGLLAAQKN
jgi:protein-disulfide isomerase